MTELIEVAVRVGGKDQTWKFKTMNIEDAALWASRIGSRRTLYESIKKQKEMLGVIHGDHHLDDNLDKFDFEKIDQYNKLSDAQAIALRDIMRITKECLDFIVEPSREFVEKLMVSNVVTVFEAINSYTIKIFPLESDQKKS